MQATGRRIIAPFVVLLRSENGNTEPRPVNQMVLRLKNCSDGLERQMQDNKTNLLLGNTTDIKPSGPFLLRTGQLARLAGLNNAGRKTTTEKPAKTIAQLEVSSGRFISAS